MPSPIPFQEVLLPPGAIHLTLEVTGIRDSGYTVTKVRVLDRPQGQQLALAVRTLPGFENPSLLFQELSEILEHCISEIRFKYVNPDPF